MLRSHIAIAVVVVATATSLAHADDPDSDSADSDLYLLPHPAAKWWLSGQLNVISQVQPGFHSPYSSDHSLRASNHAATSFVATVYAAYEVTPYTAIMVAGESAGGGGLSDALGLAGFTNLDVVRNPSLGIAPYIGRAFIDQIIPLSDERVTAARVPFGVLRTLPVRRLEIRAGKMSTVDAFDTNDIGSDSHRQFMNWAIDNNGAYDYAADTRGYTLGAIVEYAEPMWAIRFGELLMPTVANGIDYDFDVAHARGENLELEIRERIGNLPGVVKLLGFWNHARMGNYDESIAEFRAGVVDKPDITGTRVAGRTKFGFGLNLQQQVAQSVRLLARAGWSDGRNETFAYTEIDNTVELGFDVTTGPWGRTGDQFGLAAVTNGLSSGHRTYLALGGQGFLLGDGKLRYGREDIVEAYYTARACRGVFPSLDVQFVTNPGYNRDRGPVAVFSARLHVEL